MTDDDPIKLFVVTEIDEDGDLIDVSIHTTRDGAETEVRRLVAENRAMGRENMYSQDIKEREVQP